MAAGYEAFFGLNERPFSLTSDARFFFASRAHARVLDTLKNGFESRDRFVLVTGDLGAGKTCVCRTFVDELRGTSRVALITSPLIAADAFDRLLARELGLPSSESLEGLSGDALIIIDEAHMLPAPLIDHLLALSRRHMASDYVFRFAFVGQAVAGDAERLGMSDIDDRAGKKVRLLPLGREECGAYIQHRLAIAGPHHTVQFSERAHDQVFTISGGLPRLINLLCERALQEAADVGTQRIEPSTIANAASALQLLRTRSRRFRPLSKLKT